MEQECLFCKIVSGEVPSKKVYEDEQVMAILDAFPARAGHLLVMPKKHYPVLPLVPEQDFNALFKAVRALSVYLKKGVPCEAVTVFIANGLAAGQRSPHFLIHLLPRDEGDGLDFNPPQSTPQDFEALKPYFEKGESSKEELSKVLGAHPDLVKAIARSPGSVKELLKENPELGRLFQGVDLDRLSQALKGSRLASTPGKPDLDKIARLFK